MGRSLTDLADVCRRTGYPVLELDGWQNRGRSGSGGGSTSGYESGKPNHVMAHHTASGIGSDGWPDANYCTFNAESAPLCNLYIDRSGTIYVCAGRATNTNGSGHDPCGLLPDDSMNAAAIGIEAGNDGVGERWPETMLDSYNALCDELCRAYGIPIERLHGHAEYAPSRKVDPAGPERYASGRATWDMNSFRADCDANGSTIPAPLPPMPLSMNGAPVFIACWGPSGDTYLVQCNLDNTFVKHRVTGDNTYLHLIGAGVLQYLDDRSWDDWLTTIPEV